MYFIVKGLDGTDAEAPMRRQAVRAEHLDNVKRLADAGKILIAAAYIDDKDDNEQMIGSLLIFEVDSRADIDAYLAEEPYVSGDVWRTIEVSPCKVPPMFLDKT